MGIAARCRSARKPNRVSDGDLRPLPLRQEAQSRERWGSRPAAPLGTAHARRRTLTPGILPSVRSVGSPLRLPGYAEKPNAGSRARAAPSSPSRAPKWHRFSTCVPEVAAGFSRGTGFQPVRLTWPQVFTWHRFSTCVPEVAAGFQPAVPHSPLPSFSPPCTPHPGCEAVTGAVRKGGNRLFPRVFRGFGAESPGFPPPGW
jgi:hypothetical protein